MLYCMGVSERENTLMTHLNQDTIAALQSFQIEKIDRETTDILDTNSKIDTYHFEYCPKCGCYHPRLVKSGFANSGKQMLRCKECGKRFVIDRGQLTFYSHQNQSKWNELILDTLNGVSLKETAAKINVNERNVFNMRHKLLVSKGRMKLKWIKSIFLTIIKELKLME